MTKKFKKHKLLFRFMNANEEKAILASIKGDWAEAVKVNLSILKKNKNDIDALNRLSFAYIQNNHPTLAKKTIQKVLKLDKYNPIAQKNNSLLREDIKIDKNKTSEKSIKNIDFIENPGNTKIISLTDICDKKTLEKIRNGSRLTIKIRRRKICAFYNLKYIGKFPDDTSRKFIHLMNTNHSYEVVFKSFDLKKIHVLIREA